MPTLAFWKPYNVLTQFTDPQGRATLADYISVKGVYAAGRLDYDSEGLLLLTDDKRLFTKLTHEHHPRTYWAQVERVPTSEALEQLRAGVLLKDGMTRPAQARLLEREPDLPPREPPIRTRASIPTAWLELVLREGRNRQVRRMTAHVGYPTLRLVRVAIQHIGLDGLSVGQWREVTSEEVRGLKG